MAVNLKKIADLLEQYRGKTGEDFNREDWLAEIKPITEPFLVAIDEKLSNTLQSKSHLRQFLRIKGERVFEMTKYTSKKEQMPNSLHAAGFNLPFFFEILYKGKKYTKYLNVKVSVGRRQFAEGRSQMSPIIYWGVSYGGNKKAASRVYEACQRYFGAPWQITTVTSPVQIGTAARCYQSRDFQELRGETAENITQQIADDLVGLITTFEKNKNEIQEILYDIKIPPPIISPIIYLLQKKIDLEYYL